MLLILLLTATAPITPPTEAELNAATWADVDLNAMIGSGNTLVSWNWRSGHELDRPPEIKITDRLCKQRRDVFKCSFNFVRTSDPQNASPDDAREPGLLKCSAFFSFGHDDKEPQWGVLHYPPGSRSGHSRTSLKCSNGGPSKLN
jgi:hypothetical protein